MDGARADNDHPAAVLRLLDARSEGIWQAIMLAEKSGHTELMQTIIGYATSMRRAAESPSKVPGCVMQSASKGYPFTAMAWIEAGGNVDGIGADGDGDDFTMLMMASCCNRLGIVNVLIETGKASIDFMTGPEQCAILCAASLGHADIVLRLCRAGSIHVFPAMRSAEKHGHVDTVRALSTHIKKVHASLWTGGGEKLSFYIASAAADGLEATVLAWVEGGGCVDATLSAEEGTKDKTLLHFACENNQASLVSLLIKHNADTNVQDSRGVSPLIESAARGHASIVSRL